MKFAIFKIKTKVHQKMRKNTGNPNIKNLKHLKDLFSSSQKHFLGTSFSMNELLFSNKILSGIFLIASLMRMTKNPGFGHFFS